jgi:hypothetical protein
MTKGRLKNRTNLQFFIVELNVQMSDLPHSTKFCQNSFSSMSEKVKFFILYYTNV